MEDRVVSNKIHRVWLAGGIVRVQNTPGSEQTREVAEQAVAQVWEVAGHTRRPLLVDLRRIKSMDRGARTYYASAATAEVLVAVGLLVDSPLTRILANFLVGLNKPLFPTRMFTSESEALAWLQGFLP